MAIFFNFSPTSTHLHPLQVENCDSNSRLVVGEDDNGKFRLERVNKLRHFERMGNTFYYAISYEYYKIYIIIIYIINFPEMTRS